MLNTLKSIFKWFIFIWCNYLQSLASLDEKSWLEGIEMLEVFAYFYQNWIPKITYCIRCMMVCKTGFTNWNAKITLLRASMVVTYYIKLFQMETDRHNGILMSLLLFAGTIRTTSVIFTCFCYVFIYFVYISNWILVI